MAALEDETTTSLDLKAHTRRHVLGEIKSVAAASEEWLVAVLDKAATRVISSAVTMYDIMEERVTLVESLELKRQPFPEMGAIYFISPSVDSVKRLVADFSGSPRYGGAHVFFLSKVGDVAMGLLKKCPTLIQCMKTFKEINIDFLSIESNVFHFDEQPSVFGELYGDAIPPRGLVPFTERVARKLLTVCSTLHEYPIIRCRLNSPMEVRFHRSSLFVRRHHSPPNLLHTFKLCIFKCCSCESRLLGGLSLQCSTALLRHHRLGGIMVQLVIAIVRKERCSFWTALRIM